MTASALSQEEKAVGSVLGAAVGDALGWPLEGRARRYQSDVHESIGRKQEHRFVNWTRGGSRFQPYREPIAAGEYSDDTQLLLSTARSILHGPDWWEHLAFVELPFWQMYERGGGGATKRAAQSWLSGKPPWKSSQTREKYFDAGGNGVAMRILPHVLAAETGGEGQDVARQILLNGICTHGHPRALVGALLHGMTLWLSVRQEEMLEFGALTSAVSRGFQQWAQLPELSANWRDAFSNSEFRDYKVTWEKTIGECMALIDLAVEGLRLGPLSAGPETLHKMGALNPKTNGSGTITAAAALFLSSRYAASPLQGLMVAATAKGADTDTVASMCGSILGAIHGDEWLGHFADSVQDGHYLRKLATRLVDRSVNFLDRTISRVTKRDWDNFRKRLPLFNLGVDVVLPDGRHAVLRRVEPMFSESAQADLCVFETEDGQTLAVKRVVRQRKGPVVPANLPTAEILRVGIKIFVSDLALAKDFYVEKLGLQIVKEYPTSFTVGEVISVHLANSHEQRDLTFQATSLPAPTPYIRVANVDVFASRLSAVGLATTEVIDNRSIKKIRFSDPFGNELEFFEARKGNGGS
jgi:ADP-ribosylglycohydrolase/catechol 2,3-dioxygenase-like lactoylglutathione lyase family enzyme